VVDLTIVDQVLALASAGDRCHRICFPSARTPEWAAGPPIAASVLAALTVLPGVQAVTAALAMVDGLVLVREQSLPHSDTFYAMMLQPWAACNIPSLLFFLQRCAGSAASTYLGMQCHSTSLRDAKLDGSRDIGPLFDPALSSQARDCCFAGGVKIVPNNPAAVCHQL
jgi:hypothetical protein